MSSVPSFAPYKLLSFDCFGTIIDCDSGIWDALQPLVEKASASSSFLSDRETAVKYFHKIDKKLLAENPSTPYSELLAATYKQLAQDAVVEISAGEADTFGRSIGHWSAFPDSEDALNRLQKRFKLVILSNVDNASFSRVLSGPLAGVKFDAVYTAQDIGSYKPNLNNFHYLFDNSKQDLGVSKEGILHVAHSLPVDHVPAKQLKLPSIWIARGDSESDASKQFGDSIAYLKAFDSLGEMADAVEKQ